ncbi:hypothetical protein MY3296_007066 [Beauveria thailandica]
MSSPNLSWFSAKRILREYPSMTMNERLLLLHTFQESDHFIRVYDCATAGWALNNEHRPHWIRRVVDALRGCHRRLQPYRGRLRLAQCATGPFAPGGAPLPHSEAELLLA